LHKRKGQQSPDILGFQIEVVGDILNGFSGVMVLDYLVGGHPRTPDHVYTTHLVGNDLDNFAASPIRGTHASSILAPETARTSYRKRLIVTPKFLPSVFSLLRFPCFRQKLREREETGIW
jgi:hypothetical protein